MKLLFVMWKNVDRKLNLHTNTHTSEYCGSFLAVNTSSTMYKALFSISLLDLQLFDRNVTGGVPAPGNTHVHIETLVQISCGFTPA